MIQLLDDSDIKVVYDNQGNKREVLIDYAKFEKIVEFVERYAYFYSQEVQERLRASEEDLEHGRYKQVTGSEVEKGL
jgi:hypothetical protein